MNTDEIYMHRCIELAKLGEAFVAPNPMVGAVLVHDNSIIGEGYHQQYGKPHAEVNCINSVAEESKHLIPASTLYVSLEPCAHYGKTPPCADLIIKNKIQKAVVGVRDPFDAVNGKGIEKLKAAGVEVVVGVLENECRQLNKRFFTFHTQHRPYTILKWAQTANNKIAYQQQKERLQISNEFTNRMVHKWRSEQMAILIGTNTALIDSPSLTNRLWSGRNPVRLIIDMNLKLPNSLKIFNSEATTIIFNLHKHAVDEVINFESKQPLYYKLDNSKTVVEQISDACYKLNITSVLVEGGSKLLQQFIDEELWNEAITITNEQLHIENGLEAPQLHHAVLNNSEHIFNDRIQYYIRNNT